MESVRELIGFAHDKSTNKKDIAALAPLLSAACELGDGTALAIVEKSAASLLELVVPVAEKLSMQKGKLALAGSVLLKNAFIRNAFEELLSQQYPKMLAIPAPGDASKGAVIMALGELR